MIQYEELLKKKLDDLISHLEEEEEIRSNVKRVRAPIKRGSCVLVRSVIDASTVEKKDISRVPHCARSLKARRVLIIRPRRVLIISLRVILTSPVV